MDVDLGILSIVKKSITRKCIKIGALRKLIGSDATKDLQTVRQWRDWVAHRKTEARPNAVDFETAQSLIEATLNSLEECTTSKPVPLGATTS